MLFSKTWELVRCLGKNLCFKRFAPIYIFRHAVYNIQILKVFSLFEKHTLP